MDNEAMQDLRDRLIVIETLLKNMSTNTDLKIQQTIELIRLERDKLKAEYDEKFKVQNHRINDLETVQKENEKAIKGNILSLIITVVGGIILFLIQK